MSVDVTKQLGINRQTADSCQVEEPKEQFRTVEKTNFQLCWNCQRASSHNVMPVQPRRRQQLRDPIPQRHAPAPIDKASAEFMEPHRVPVVLLHELFDCQQMRLVLEPEVVREPDLFVKREDLLRHAGSNMHECPHVPQKVARLVQRLVPLSRNESSIRQFTDRVRLVPGHPDPLEQVDVPQAPLALFDIRLEQVNRLAKLLVFFTAFLDFLRNKPVNSSCNHPTKVAAMKVLKQLGTSSEKSGFHHRGPDRQVCAGQPDAVLNCSDAVAHLQAEIPERVQHLTHEFRNRASGFG